MTVEESLPLYARTSMLKFILGPAEFVLHHLETRIQLSEKVDILVIVSLRNEHYATNLLNQANGNLLRSST